MAFKTLNLSEEQYEMLDKKRKQLEKQLGLKLSLADTVQYLLKES